MKTMWKFLMAAALAIPLMCGCDGGGGDDAAPTVDVTGTWKGTSTFLGQTDSETLSLSQNGSDVSGTDPEGLNYSGSVSGKTLTLTTSVSNGSDVLSLHVTGDVEGDSVVLSGTVSGTIEGANIDGPITFNLKR